MRFLDPLGQFREDVELEVDAPLSDEDSCGPRRYGGAMQAVIRQAVAKRPEGRVPAEIEQVAFLAVAVAPALRRMLDSTA